MIIYPMKNRIGKDHIKFLLKRQIQRIAYLEFYFRKLIFRLVYHAARTVNAYNSVSQLKQPGCQDACSTSKIQYGLFRIMWDKFQQFLAIFGDKVMLVVIRRRIPFHIRISLSCALRRFFK